MSLAKQFEAPKFRVFRASVYVALGLWGIVPICHQLWLHPSVWAIQQAFKLDLAMGFFYLVSQQDPGAFGAGGIRRGLDLGMGFFHLVSQQDPGALGGGSQCASWWAGPWGLPRGVAGHGARLFW